MRESEFQCLSKSELEIDKQFYNKSKTVFHLRLVVDDFCFM